MSNGSREKPQRAPGGHQCADAGEILRVDPVHQAGGDAGSRHQAEAERQERHACLDRAEAHHGLDVLAEVEEHREHRRRREEHRHEARRTGAVHEHAHRQQRVLDAALGQQEDDDQRDTGDQAGDRPGVAPAVGAGAAQAVDQAEQAQGAGEGAGQVELTGVRLGLGQEARREEGCDDADRGVDQQGQAPALDVEAEEAVHAGQPAAEQQAHGRAHTGHGGVDRERAVAQRACREGRGDQRESSR